MNKRRSFLRYLGACAAFLLALSVSYWRAGVSVTPPGPALRIAESAIELVTHGSLEPPSFQEIARNAQAMSVREYELIEQDVFALGKNGRLYPKHPLLAIWLSAIFYAAFGSAGFWLLQQCFTFALLAFLYLCIGKLESSVNGVVLLAVAIGGTQLPFYTYILNYDVFAAAFIVAGLWLSHRSPLWGGVVSGLSLLIRPTHILLLPFLAVAWWQRNSGKRRLLDTILGWGAVAIVWMAINTAMWGSPLTTVYHRLLLYSPEGASFYQHPIGFDWNVFAANWGKKLFDSQHGLLRYNPALLLLPLVFWQMYKRPDDRLFFGSIVSGAVFYCLYVFSFTFWSFSLNGSRFLLPPLSLFIIVTIIAVQRTERKETAGGDTTPTR